MRLIPVFILILASGFVNAATVNLTCEPPILREDSTPLQPGEIASYQFFKNGNLLQESTDCAYSYAEPDQSLIEYQVKAKDTQWLLSAYSKQIAINLSPPMAPNLKVTITVELTQ
jgi:hypothetical protein